MNPAACAGETSRLAITEIGTSVVAPLPSSVQIACPSCTG